MHMHLQARKAVLEKYANGIEDFVCCQGYAGKCCCIEPGTYCKGSAAGLCCEGCCCPMISLSIARVHLMDMKQVCPDPHLTLTLTLTLALTLTLTLTINLTACT